MEASQLHGLLRTHNGEIIGSLVLNHNEGHLTDELLLFLLCFLALAPRVLLEELALFLIALN